MCYILLICKGPTTFSKTKPVNLKPRSLKTSLKETSADMEKYWVITQSLNTYRYSYKIPQQKQLQLQSRKNKYGN